MHLSSNELKNTKTHFTYCPRCKRKLEEKHLNLLTCPNCNLHLFINPTPSTGAVLVNENCEILLVKRKVEPGKGLWDIPGGFVDLNENLEECLTRELKEELGVDVKNLKYLASKIDMYKYKDIYQQTLGTIFEGEISSKENLVPTDDISGYEFFKKENFPIDKLAFKSLEDFFKDYLKLDNKA